MVRDMSFGVTKWRLAVLLAAAAFLAGCASPLPRQAFNAAGATHVKKVVITQDPNQDEYEVVIVGHPGLSFGLVGALVAAADMQGKTKQLTGAIDVKETRLQERFGERLAQRLKAAGYEPQIVVLPKDAKEPQALALAKQQVGSDAVLHVQLRGGYWAAGPTSDYFPRMVAKVKKYDVRSDKVLYEDTITFGYAAAHSETVHLASEPAFRFKDIDTLVANPQKVRDGLFAGVDALAGQIAADLKRP